MTIYLETRQGNLNDVIKNASIDALVSHVKLELTLKHCTHIKTIVSETYSDFKVTIIIDFKYAGIDCKIIFFGIKGNFDLNVENMFENETCLTIASMFKKLDKKLKIK